MNIVEIFKDLESTRSRNHKLAVLRDNKDNRILREILFYTYNPYYDFYIKKLPKLKTTGTKTVEESWDEFKGLLDQLRKRQITGNEAKDAVVNFLETVDEDAQEIYKYVLNRKFTKAGVNKRTINTAFNEEFIPVFSVQLAKKFDLKRRHMYPDSFYYSPKLDGIRCIYLHKQDKLFSRNGKEITNLDTIRQSCKKICEDYALDFVDGELWSYKFDFNTVQSAVMSNKNVKEDLAKEIRLNVFAVGDHIDDTEHLARLLLDIKLKNYPHINIVEQKPIRHDLNLIVNTTIDYLEMGYEGIMLRHPENYYDWDRTDNLLKVKEFQLKEILEKASDELDEQTRIRLQDFLSDRNVTLSDLYIVGFEEGTGNYEGMLGAFIVEGVIDGKKIRSKVGIGLKLDERIKYWNMKDELLGKEVEVECQEITKDGSIRFPIIKAIKLDR